MGPAGGRVEDRRAYEGVDRGFIFFESEKGAPWRGITDVEVLEDSYLVETYYMDGRKIGHRFHKGNFHAKVTSYDNPFEDPELMYDVRGFSYREHYSLGGKNHYRLHIVHGASIRYLSSVQQTYNVSDPKDITTFRWEVDSLDVDLRENVELKGSHLILDSSQIFDWSLRDIENVLYDEGRIPSIDEMMDIFSEMNLIIIDHGDGTWSAVGHESMIQMLDATEFVIETPTIIFDEVDPRTYDIYDLIRDERWLE